MLEEEIISFDGIKFKTEEEKWEHEKKQPVLRVYLGDKFRQIATVEKLSEVKESIKRWINNYMYEECITTEDMLGAFKTNPKFVWKDKTYMFSDLVTVKFDIDLGIIE